MPSSHDPFVNKQLTTDVPVKIRVEAARLKVVNCDFVGNDLCGREGQACHNERHGIDLRHGGHQALLGHLEVVGQTEDAVAKMLLLLLLSHQVIGSDPTTQARQSVVQEKVLKDNNERSFIISEVA